MNNLDFEKIYAEQGFSVEGMTDRLKINKSMSKYISMYEEEMGF
jgi:hypothetical protein